MNIMQLSVSTTLVSIMLVISGPCLAQSSAKSLGELDTRGPVAPEVLLAGTGEKLTLNCIQPNDFPGIVTIVRQSIDPSTGLTTRFEVLNTYTSIEYCRPNAPLVFPPTRRLRTYVRRTCYNDAIRQMPRSYLVYEITDESTGLTADLVPRGEFASPDACLSHLD